MLLKDLSFLSPAENILYDEVLLQLAEKTDSGDVLRLWESKSVFVVLGRTSALKDDVDLVAVRADEIPVLRRFSGGGTVVQGPGCLNFSLILSKERNPGLSDLRRSYQEILNSVQMVMKKVGVDAVFRPISDLALAGSEQKFSGNAQHRGRKYILHHGTILYDFDLALIEKYLKFPKSVPAYRAGRCHQDFVKNIPVDAVRLRQAFCDYFQVQLQEAGLTSGEKELLQEFVLSRTGVVRV